MTIKEGLNPSPMALDEFFFPIPDSPIGANTNSPCTCTWYRDADYQANFLVMINNIVWCGPYQMASCASAKRKNKSILSLSGSNALYDYIQGRFDDFCLYYAFAKVCLFLNTNNFLLFLFLKQWASPSTNTLNCWMR